MCLAVPMKVIKIEAARGVVELGGLRHNISLELLEEVNIDDYVIVHAGFAIQKLDKKNAEETLSLLKEIT